MRACVRGCVGARGAGFNVLDASSHSKFRVQWLLPRYINEQMNVSGCGLIVARVHPDMCIM